MSRGFINALLWLAAGSTAFVVALVWAPAVYVDGQYLPTGHDSFYHARRILDAVNSPASSFLGVFQFDPDIHAPEGSWVTWPWAYDGAVAMLLRGLETFSLDPRVGLVYVPTVSVFINVGLILAIVRLLGFSSVLCAVALGCYALSPLTQALHGLGRIDHHYVEQIFTLATLYLGMYWFQAPHRRLRAGTQGFVLGVASAFYNGLFILIGPVVGLLLVARFRGLELPLSPVCVWAVGLVLGIGMATLPSEPLLAGEFAYYLLSWFHVYVVCASALFAALVVWTPPGARSMFVLVGVAGLLAIPVLREFGSGLTLVVGAIPGLSEMTDAHSPVSVVLGDPMAAAREYTALIWVLPATIGWQLVRLAREPQPARVYFHMVCLAGVMLMLQQHRFHQYGSFALYLPALLLVSDLRWSKSAPGLTAVLVALAYLPAIPKLTEYPVPGFSGAYFLTQGGYHRLAAACREAPGVVLAEPTAGHYIRYHTDCAVIANNFLTTKQHLAKIALVGSLRASSVAALRERAPWVRYLWLVRDDNVLDTELTPEDIASLNTGLNALLLDSGPMPGQVPHQVSDQLELLWEVRLPPALVRAPELSVLARLYRVRE